MPDKPLLTGFLGNFAPCSFSAIEGRHDGDVISLTRLPVNNPKPHAVRTWCGLRAGRCRKKRRFVRQEYRAKKSIVKLYIRLLRTKRGLANSNRGFSRQEEGSQEAIPDTRLLLRLVAASLLWLLDGGTPATTTLVESQSVKTSMRVSWISHA